MKKLTILCILLCAGIANAAPIPIMFPTAWHQEDYLEAVKADQFRVKEYSIYTDNIGANFHIEFNKTPIFNGYTHGFGIRVSDVESVSQIGEKIIHGGYVSGWGWTDGTHLGIYSGIVDQPEVGPWDYVLDGSILDFSIPLSLLDVDETFAYWIDVADFSRNDTSLSVGYVGNTYNADTPEASSLILIGLGLLGLGGFGRRKWRGK